MREIRFRAWDAVTKKMLTGFHLFGEITIAGGIFAWQAEEAGSIGIKREALTGLNDLLVMQFTGLFDADDTLIYEGDIMIVSNMEFSHFEDSGVPGSPNEIFEDFRGPVSFNNGQFEVDGHSAGKIPLSAIQQIDMKVIGNVYENPELI